MAGYKKKLPISAALRPGGEGTVAPPKPGATKGLGLGNLSTMPRGASPPSIGGGGGSSGTPKIPTMPKLPKMAKIPKFK